MTTLQNITNELYANNFFTPRSAARKIAAKFADVEIIEAQTQDHAIIFCDECHVEIKWMNRAHTSIIACEI